MYCKEILSTVAKLESVRNKRGFYNMGKEDSESLTCLSGSCFFGEQIPYTWSLLMLYE